MNKRGTSWKRTAIVAALLIVPTAVALYFGRSRLVSLFDLPSAKHHRESVELLPVSDRAPVRNKIFDRNFEELAVSFQRSSVFVRPLELHDVDAAARRLAVTMGLDGPELLTALKTERGFVWLGQGITGETARRVAALKLEGVHFVNTVQRFYPRHKTAAQVIGFVKGERGLAGIESFYDNVLNRGQVLGTDLNALGLCGLAGRDTHVVLNLDLRIQSLLEERLASLTEKSGAATAMAAVMVPADGRVLAMAHYPSFDPNYFWKYKTEVIGNRLISEPVYAGELMRIFYMAAARGNDSGALRPETDTAVETDKEPDTLSGMPGLAISGTGQYSSPRLLSGIQPPDPGEWQTIVRRLGLSGTSGIDLPSEKAAWSTGGPGNDSSLAMLKGEHDEKGSFSTSAMHLLTAFSRLVNGGRQIVPLLLRGVWDNAAGRLVDCRPPTKAGKKHPATGASTDAIFERFADRGQVLLESWTPDLKIGSASGPPPGDSTYQAVMLGMVPGQHPEISMVAVLDGARLEPDWPSPFTTMKLFMEKAVAFAREPSFMPASAAILKDMETKVYRQWQGEMNHVEDEPAPPDAGRVLRMPDVTGLSLRKGLQVLQAYGLHVLVKGSGRIVSQQPVPGSVIDDAECVLQLTSCNLKDVIEKKDAGNRQ